jgi:hypothetical protein
MERSFGKERDFAGMSHQAAGTVKGGASVGENVSIKRQNINI